MPPKPFKPPRPSTAIKKTTRAKPAKRAQPSSRKSTTAEATKAKSHPMPSVIASSSRPSASTLPSLSPSSQSSSQASDTEIEIEETPKSTIPPELLTRLLHEFFKEDGTRISKDANAAVGRYMETFVREALARAAFTRAEDEGEGDGFLEVEDLEKLAPQLLLDF